MKIALLNLPFDNNYGGNLQRYALVKMLESMGHDVTYLYCVSSVYKIPHLKMPFVIMKRIIRKYVLRQSDCRIFAEKYNARKKEKSNEVAHAFVRRYIKSSPQLKDKQELTEYITNNAFEAFVVGSDQVWRKAITHQYGIATYFLDFLSDNNTCKKVAFAASLGTETNELTRIEIELLGKLYRRFDATSVREDSSLHLLAEYGWNNPEPEVIIDPTFMLDKDSYIKLIEDGNTVPLKADMFCYILDPTAEKSDIIDWESKTRKYESYIMSLDSSSSVSIQQWLRFFHDAKFVVTDSFHGVCFSIIFNKPFRLISNVYRGTARFNSLFRILGIDENTSSLNYGSINHNIKLQVEKSAAFLNRL